MLTITISGNTINDVRDRIKLEFGLVDPPKESASAPKATLEISSEPEKKKAGRPKAAPTAVEPEAANPFEDAAPPAAPATATKADAESAAKALNGKKGLAAVQSALKKFSANKMSELKAEHYAAFSQICQAQL